MVPAYLATNLEYDDKSNQIVSNLYLQIHLRCSFTKEKPMWGSFCQEEMNEILQWNYLWGAVRKAH